MKKATLLIVFCCIISLFNYARAQNNADIVLENFVQVNETEFTFDAYIEGVSGTFVLFSYSFRVQIDNDIFPTGVNFETAELTWDDLDDIDGGPRLQGVNKPSYFATGAAEASFVSTSNSFSFNSGQYVSGSHTATEITPGTKYLIDRFRVILKDGGDKAAFKDALPEWTVVLTGGASDILEAENVTGTVINGSGTFSNATRLNQVHENFGTRQLASYCFTGDGDWTDAGNWNVASGGIGDTPVFPGEGNNVIINGNVIIPDGTTVELTPNAGVGGELTVITADISIEGDLSDSRFDFIMPDASLVFSNNWTGVFYDEFKKMQQFPFLFNDQNKRGESHNKNSRIITVNKNVDGDPNGVRLMIRTSPNGSTWTTQVSYTIDDPVVFDASSFVGDYIRLQTALVPEDDDGEWNGTFQGWTYEAQGGPFSGLAIAPGAAITVDKLFNDHEDGAEAIILQSPDQVTKDGLHGPAGSLIHNNEDVPATVERYIKRYTSGPEDDLEGWHFLSSPVINQDIVPEFFPDEVEDPDWYAAVDFYYWDESHLANDTYGWWINIKGSTWDVEHTQFEMGRGYLMAYKAAGTKTYGDKVHRFTGNMHVTDISKTLSRSTDGTYQGWHLLGNPFASALAWNNGENWNDGNITGGPQIWNEKQGDYIPIVGSPEPGDLVDIIPAMNGFMVQATVDDAPITIPAANRVHSDHDWYKNRQTGTRIHLIANNLVNGSAKSAMVIFREDAEPGLDNLDYRFLSGHGPRFFTPIDGVWCSVNALPEYYDGMTIPFSFMRNSQHGDFSIELADVVQGLLDEHYDLYLEDLKLGLMHNLSMEPKYFFTSENADAPQRFLLHLTQKDDPTGIDDEASEATTGMGNAWSYQESLFVYSTEDGMQVNVFDISGRQVRSYIASIGQQAFQHALPAGIYMVRLTGQNQTKTVKVVVR